MNPFKSIARRFLGTVVRVDTTESVIALTFDDGPHPEYTPQLLRILDRHGARATFFMVGQLAAKYPSIVKEVVQHGHAVGNHSWDHSSFPLLDGSQRRQQIRRCASVLVNGGQRLFRPPFGHQSMASRIDAWFMGYDVIAWNILADDWLDHGSEEIFDKLSKRIKPGSIILLHDSLFTAESEAHLGRAPTLEAVDRLLEECADYEFVTISELMNRGRPVRQLWERQGDSGWLDRQKKWGDGDGYR